MCGEGRSPEIDHCRYRKRDQRAQDISFISCRPNHWTTELRDWVVQWFSGQLNLISTETFERTKPTIVVPSIHTVWRSCVSLADIAVYNRFLLVLILDIKDSKPSQTPRKVDRTQTAVFFPNQTLLVIYIFSVLCPSTRPTQVSIDRFYHLRMPLLAPKSSRVRSCLDTPLRLLSGMLDQPIILIKSKPPLIQRKFPHCTMDYAEKPEHSI